MQSLSYFCIKFALSVQASVLVLFMEAFLVIQHLPAISSVDFPHT